MANQGEERRACQRIPESRGAIPAHCGNSSAVRAELYVKHRCFVTRKRQDLLAGRSRVPHSNGVVAACRGYAPSIRAVRNPKDGQRMAAESECLLTGFGIANAGVAAIVGDGQISSVRTVDDTLHI